MTFHGSNKLWEWLVMPFGLKNALVFFQRIMDQVLEGTDFLKCYIDDILMHNKGLLQHLAHLEELFKRLHEVNMKIHPKKCEFVVTLVIYLGHRISRSFQHIQGKAFRVPYYEETRFQQGLHFTHWLECSWYWCYSWPIWWGRQGYVITYASWSNNKAESNYSSYEGECLVIVWVVIHFRPYLYGTNFTLYTDH